MRQLGALKRWKCTPQPSREGVVHVTRYYQGKIPYYDIINEANKIPWANELNFSTEQFLDKYILCGYCRRDITTSRGRRTMAQTLE